MTHQDWLSVRAAMEYVKKNALTFPKTNIEEDTEIEHAQIRAFLAGVEYAKNNP